MTILRPFTLIALVTLSCFILALPVSAATFNVTSAWCTGPDSISQAINDANANPGEDTISIQAGLEINFQSCLPTDPFAPYASIIEESVVIEGNGATLKGRQAWVAEGGAINTESCPSKDTGTIIVAKSPGFLSIGNRRADNSGIGVEITNLSAVDLSAFAKVYEGAQLELDQVHLMKIQDAVGDCNRGAIEGYPGSVILVKNSTIEDFKNYGSFAAKNVFNSALNTFGGTLYLQDSIIRRSNPSAGISGGAVSATDSDVRIVGSQFINAGGISILGSAGGDTKASIVNSMIRIGSGAGQFDRIYSSFYTTVEIQASTIVSSFAACGTIANCPPPGSQTMPFYADGGQFNLSESAIGVWGDFIPGALLYAERGGSYTADPFTYVQPVDGQDAATLRSLTGQPALLTDPPALPGEATGLTFQTPADYVKWVTPIVPGVLIDAVVDAGPGGANQLLNPIDGTFITKDVFGNDRVDSNGARNIGAVQLTLAPSLHATARDGAVDLDWTRPQDPIDGAIDGYDGYSNVTGWIPLTNDPDTLTSFFDGLTNGVEQEFKVRARYGPPLVGPFGPESNLAVATPYGDIGTPVLTATPGDGEVTLTWTRPDDGGRELAGYLPRYRIVGLNTWAFWPFVQGGDTLQTTITGLFNGLEFEFGISALSVDNFSSDIALAKATPQVLPTLSYASPVTVIENSIVSILPSVTGLTQTPLYLLFGGTLPDGLQLDSATGQISGEATSGSAGDYNVTVLLSQAGLPSSFDVTTSLTITVIAASPDLYLHYPDIDVSAGAGPLDVVPTVTGTEGGTLSYAMSTGDILPDGLVLNPVTGQITGVPTTATDGFRGLSVEVTESGGTAPRLAVSPLIVRIQPTLSYDPAEAIVGDPITIVPNVSPSAVAGTFSLDSGDLPLGMSFDPASGVVSGTPESNEFGILNITYTMTGGQTQQVSAQLLISVLNYTIDFSYPAASFTPGVPFTLAPTVSGTKGIVTYSIEAGSLPDGLSLDSATGVISGTPIATSSPGQVLVEVVDAYNSAQALVEFRFMDSAFFTVSKIWEVPQAGFEEITYDVGVFVSCDAYILSVDGQASDNPGSSVTVTLGDGQSSVLEIDTGFGTATCSATENVTQSGVESSAEGCDSVSLPAGSEEQCTFTNTVFFEGIPTLDRLGLALLALLMLSVGFVGFRRFV